MSRSCRAIKDTNTFASNCFKASSSSTLVKLFPPESASLCQEQWKLGGFASTENIGRHCCGINTLSQRELDVFLMFLARPWLSAAASGAVCWGLVNPCLFIFFYWLWLSVWWQCVGTDFFIHPLSLRAQCGWSYNSQLFSTECYALTNLLKDLQIL